MSKSSRNAQKSTGPRTIEGKAKCPEHAPVYGLASGCFLHMEDKDAFLSLLNEYVGTYCPRHRDELDLLTEAVYAKWRQHRIWLAETAQIEIAIALSEREFVCTLPNANMNAHLANGVAHSENMMRLYGRYDAQLHRHYLRCLKELRDLQAERDTPDDSPSEPKPPQQETESPPPPTPKTTPEAPAETDPHSLRLQLLRDEIRHYLAQRAAREEN